MAHLEELRIRVSEPTGSRARADPGGHLHSLVGIRAGGRPLRHDYDVDLLSTTTLGWLAIRAVVGGSGVSLLAAGVVVGIGVEAKPQLVLVAAVMAAALIVAGPRLPLRSRSAICGPSLRGCWLPHTSSGSSSTGGRS